ncbi:MAG: hypothetical protein CL946_02840 [Ectothiorhodospiraceae bacterium]|nr:hypothetical protein [Ectothiorhodospiraceae bacterium]
MKRMCLSLAIAAALGVLCALCAPSAFAQSGSWTQQPTPSGAPGFWSIAMKDTGAGIATGAVDLGSGFSGVYRKVQGNPTWQTVNPNAFTPAIPGSFNNWYEAAAFPGSSTAYVCGNNSKVYKSTDDGATWTQQTNGIGVSKSLFGMHFADANTGLVVGDDGVAFYTTNGGANWTSQSTGTTATLYGVGSAGGSWYAAGQFNTVLKFTPPSTWTTLSIAPHNPTGQQLADVQALSASTAFVSGGNVLLEGNVLRTTNGGSGWSDMNVPNSSGPYFFNGLYFFTAAKGWVANAFNTIYYTTNAGQNWNSHSAIPSVGLAGAVTKMDFPIEDIGYASGGALNVGSTSGWIIRWEANNAAPDISSSAADLDFGSMGCESNKDVTYTIRNSGTADLVIDPGEITFTNAALSLQSALPITIPAGGNQDITVRWSPPQGFSGQLPGNTRMNIASNDPDDPTWSVAITGERIKPVITLAGTSLSFSQICLKDSDEQTITGNVSGPPYPVFLAFVHASGNDGVQVQSPAPGTTITGQTDFVFRHTPTGAGARSGTYYFISGSGSCPDTTVVSFSGEVNSSAFNFPPGPIDFGDACIGQAVEISIPLTNTGTVASQILRRELVSGNDLFPDPHVGGFGPVPPGGTQNYRMRFAPLDGDPRFVSARYRFILGPCLDTVEIVFHGNAVSSEITVAPSTLAVIGPVPVGSTGSAEVTIYNKTFTTARLTSGALRPGAPELALLGLPAFPYTMAANDSLVLQIEYTPTAEGSIATELCVDWDLPCDGSTCIDVLASSSAPARIVVTSQKYIGLQRCESPILDTLEVANNGSGPLQISSLAIEGPDKDHFSVIGPGTPYTIQPGATGMIIVEYNSPLDGQSDATLVIQHNDDQAGNESRVGLQANREVASFTIIGDTASVLSACLGKSVSRELTIRNNSPRQIQILQVSFTAPDGGFTAAPVSVPRLLNPGEEIKVNVTFNASEAGSKTGTLSVFSQPCSLVKTVTLRGEASGSLVAFIPPSVDFGPVILGASSSRLLEILNTESKPVTIDSISFTDAFGTVQKIAGPALPQTVNPAQRLAMTLEYSPAAEGQLNGMVCLHISSPCRIVKCIDMRGSGITEGLAVDKTLLEFPMPPCGTDAMCDTIRVTNSSPNTYTISTIEMDPLNAVLDFTASPPLPIALAQGEEAEIVVCAQANFTGMQDAVLRLYTDDPNNQQIPVQLRAIREDMNINVPLELDFGTIARCPSRSSSLELRIVNNGTVDVEFEIDEDVAYPFGVVFPGPYIAQRGDTGIVTLEFKGRVFGIWRDTLVLRETTCGTRYPIALNAVYSDADIQATPSILSFSGVPVGGSEQRQFTVINNTAIFSQIESVTFDDPVFTSPAAFPLGVPAVGSETIPVVFSPTSDDVFTAACSIAFDTPCRDTIIVSVTGSVNAELLVFEPGAHAFDTLVHCEEQVLVATLRNLSPDDIELQSSVIQGPGAAAYIIVDPVTPGEPLLGQGARQIRVRFSPPKGSSGALTAQLVIATNSPAQPNVALDLTGHALSLGGPASVSLDFGPIPAGFVAQRTIQLTNANQLPITYDPPELPQGMRTSPPFPITIQPGETRSVDVIYVPVIPGQVDEGVPFISSGRCTDTTMFNFTALVEGSGVSLAALTMIDVASCERRQAFTLFVNGLPDNATITDVRIEGPDAALFQVIDPAAPPVVVVTQSDYTIELLFTPEASVRTYTAACVTEFTYEGMTYTVSSPIAGNSYVPELTLISSADLGEAVAVYETKTVAITLRNNTPKPIELGDADFSGAEFTVMSAAPAFGTPIPPGGEVTLQVAFTPAQLGDTGDDLMLHFDAPCPSQQFIPLTGRGLEQEPLPIGMRIGAFSGELDEIVTVPIELLTNLAGENVTTWMGEVTFNPTMLYPQAVRTEGTLSETMNLTVDYDHSLGILSLTAEGGTFAAQSGTVAEVEFLVMLGNSGATELGIGTGFEFSRLKREEITFEAGRFTLLNFCEDGGSRYLGTPRTTTLYPNAPNPFRTSTSISYFIPDDRHVLLRVSNVLGDEVAVLTDANMPSGMHRVAFDGSGLPSGHYIVTLIAGEDVRTRSIIVQ